MSFVKIFNILTVGCAQKKEIQNSRNNFHSEIGNKVFIYKETSC